ncbi:phosphotyrosine protein phosphatase [Streptomyces sp. CNQ-509]|uniref:arsenate reductase/protein-tyrosine-phosphatase family protein n=1 Tax=unclassified Streptomyces TaxID=2593676 RepID=UPI00062DFEAB|nr:low molecular weight phosphatase family protein [Streptomyces sp. CNQ-509]AKH82261.1 phosphotyrosine protein phosphatase [Streptomyces sp. CNQ-509]
MSDPGGQVRPDPRAGHRLALHTAAKRLRTEFQGVFGEQTIERFLYGAYGDIAVRGAPPDDLPRLTERYARRRLHALARVEEVSGDGRPVVLFLCAHNAGRSLMAMGLMARLAGNRAVAWSAGSAPGASANAAAVAVMGERGIDISGEFPTAWTDEVVRAADVIVTMGCGDASPVFPGKRYVDWPQADPHGWAVAEVRPLRDEIEQRVRKLLADLGIPPRG